MLEYGRHPGFSLSKYLSPRPSPQGLANFCRSMMETSPASMARPSWIKPSGSRVISFVISRPSLRILVGFSYKQENMDVLSKHSCLLSKTLIYISQTDSVVVFFLQFDMDIK